MQDKTIYHLQQQHKVYHHLYNNDCLCVLRSIFEGCAFSFKNNFVCTEVYLKDVPLPSRTTFCAPNYI